MAEIYLNKYIHNLVVLTRPLFCKIMITSERLVREMDAIESSTNSFLSCYFQVQAVKVLTDEILLLPLL